MFVSVMYESLPTFFVISFLMLVHLYRKGVLPTCSAFSLCRVVRERFISDPEAVLNFNCFLHCQPDSLFSETVPSQLCTVNANAHTLISLPRQPCVFSTVCKSVWLHRNHLARFHEI